MNSTITQHGIWQLVKSIAQNDTRVRGCHYWDALTVDPRSVELPALVFRYGQVRVDRSVIYATFHLIAFDRVLPDRSNAALIPSQLTTLLLDINNAVSNNVDSWGLGIIPYGEPSIGTAPEDEEATVKAQGLTFTLQLPDTACLTSLGFAPIDVAGDGYSYTGTTDSGSAFQCSDLLTCDVFNQLVADLSSVSATTISHTSSIASLSGITSTHTSQIAELYTLTGGTSGGVTGDFLPLSGGTGGEYTFTGTTYINTLAVTDAIYLFDQLPYGVAFVATDQELVNDPVGFWYEPISQTVTAQNVSGYTVSGSLLFSGSTNIGDLLAAKVHTHESADITDASTGGNGAADAALVALYGDEGQLHGSANGGGNYAVRGTGTFGATAGGFFAVNGPGLEVTSQTGKGASIITDGDQIGLQVQNDSSTTQPALDVTNAGTADIAHFEGSVGNVNIMNNGGLLWTTTSGVTTTRTNLGLNTVFAQPGSNAYTASTAGGTIVGVIGSPVFTAVTAGNFISGSTNLSDIFAPIGSGGAATYVQPGNNTTTGGTPSRPTVELVSDPSVRNLTANTLFEKTYTTTGGIYYRGPDGVITNSPDWTFDDGSSSVNIAGKYYQNGILLDALFAPISVVPTYVQNGTNTTTGGTITRPTVNVSTTPSFTSVSATTISATTFVQNGTALSSLFAPIGVVPTYVQPGLNTTTGGTITRPTVNLAGSISLTAVTASGTIQARDVVGTSSLSGANVTATTLVSTTATITTVNATNISLGGTALGSLYAPISVVPTYVQNGTNTTTGGTITRPTINVSSTPSFTSVSSTTATADTFYCGSVAQSNTTSVRLASNFVTSSATYVDVTALSFPVEANTSYSFQFIIAGSSSGATTGAAYALNGPASPTLITYMMQGVQSAGALFQHATSYDFGAAAGSVAIANTNYTYLITGTLVNGANAGTLIVRAIRGGTAANITAKAGSSGLLTKTS